MLENKCNIPSMSPGAIPRWLSAFVILQVILGVVFLTAATFRLFVNIWLPLPVPPFSMGTLHLALAYSLWRQRKWFWIPNVLVLAVPVVWLIVDRVCGGILV